MGSFYGKPVAFLIYILAKSLKKDTIETLWLGIVGASYIFLYNKISGAAIEDMTYEFQRDC